MLPTRRYARFSCVVSSKTKESHDHDEKIFLQTDGVTQKRMTSTRLSSALQSPSTVSSIASTFSFSASTSTRADTASEIARERRSDA